jgi:hypothetical protein
MLALAAAALGLFYVLFSPRYRQVPDDAVFPLPLSTESRPAGYLALWRWLAVQRVPAKSLRYRYDRLPSLVARPTGNLLLMTLPQRVAAREGERAQLKRWVEAGNTLLIVAAMDDLPSWALNNDPETLTENIEKLTALHVRSDVAGLLRGRLRLAALTPNRLDIEPRGEHPLVAGVRHLTAVSELPLLSAELVNEGEAMPFELVARADNHHTALWLEKSGAGQILLSSVASPFSNAAVALDDNARLLANIIDWCCGAGGTVVFDDAHQGATAYYDGKAFFADPRLHRTLGWIVLLWLAFVLGALPLRAARRAWQPLDEAAYIEASAGYFAAVVPPSEAAQRLIERFLEDLRRAATPSQSAIPLQGATAGEGLSLWARFDAHPRVSDRQRRTLHSLYEKACNGQHINLTRLQGLLSQLRGTLE